MLTLKRASCLTLSVLATLALGTACSPTTTKTGGQPLTAPAPGDGSGAPGVGTTSPWGTGSSTNPISALLNGSSQAAVTSAANVTTYHNDTFRTGQQNAESSLTPSNVNAGTFGKIGSLPVQGYVAAQPLWVTGVQVPGSGAHDLLFVATEHDQVYAFDTNDLTAAPVWQRDFLGDSVLPCPAGAGNCRTLNFLDMAGAPNVLPEAGITATPVIDTTANAIYVVAQTVENGVPFWKLHSLNLGTGAELANSPVEVTGTVNATAPGSVGDQLTFDPVTQLSRTGLALDQGIVYFGASSFDDQEPAHGWVFAYDTATNSLAYYVSTPHEGDGNVWMGGGAPAVDTDHTLFVTTGNADGNDFDSQLPPAPSATDPDDSVIHLGKLSNGGFGQLDFFQPYNHIDLASRDVELGSGGVLLIPADTAHTAGKNLLLAAGKQATMYLLNRANLGGVTNSAAATNDPTVVQELIPSGNQTLDVRMGVQTTINKPGLAGNSAGRGFFSTASYYNGNVYVWNTSDVLRSIPLTNGFLNWADSQSDPSNYVIKNRGATMTISSNSGQNGVLWAIDSSAYKYSYSETPPVYPAGCIVTAGSAAITGCNTLASMTVGMTVFGAGIAVGTTVASIDTANFAFTLSQNAHDPFLDNNSEASGDVIPLTYYAPGTAGANFARIVTSKPDPTGAYSTSNNTILYGAITGAPVVQFTYDWVSSAANCGPGTALPALPGSPNTTICQTTDVWAYEPADYAGTNATGNVDYTTIPFTNEVSSLGQSSLQTTSDSVTGLPDYIETTYWISNAFCYPGTAVSTATSETAYCQTVAITPITKAAPAVLLAYDPTSLTKIYESDLQGAQPGSAVKFTVPTVANGMVFVGTGTEVSVFGLFNPPTQSVTITNSASFIKNQLAPGALATIFSSGLTTETASATVVPLTNSLGATNTQVFVNGTASAMLYISPTQINFQIPPTTAVGMATVQVYAQGAMTASTQVPISQQAIGIFTATNPNQPGFLNGVMQYYTTVNGKVTASPAYYTATGTYPNYSMLPISLDPSLGSPYLEVYATGLNASPTATDNTAAPTILITDSKGVTTSVTTTYAGQQHTYAGLDQVNVPLPPNLAPGTVTLQFPSGTAQPAVQMEISN